jgi:hypothetical protein
MPTADIFLPDGPYLHLAQDPHARVGWWLVDGPKLTPLSVAAAFELAPPPLRHEVVLEAERLVELVNRHRDRPDLDTRDWRVAIASLRDSVHAAHERHGDAERMRDLGHTLADHLG